MLCLYVLRNKACICLVIYLSDIMSMWLWNTAARRQRTPCSEYARTAHSMQWVRADSTLHAVCTRGQHTPCSVYARTAHSMQCVRADSTLHAVSTRGQHTPCSVYAQTAHSMQRVPTAWWSVLNPQITRWCQLNNYTCKKLRGPRAAILDLVNTSLTYVAEMYFIGFVDPENKFGYQKHVSGWSRNWDITKIRFGVWTQRPFWKTHFCSLFGHILRGHYTMAVLSLGTYTMAVLSLGTYTMAVLSLGTYTMAVLSLGTYTMAVLSLGTYTMAVLSTTLE